MSPTDLPKDDLMETFSQLRLCVFFFSQMIPHCVYLTENSSGHTSSFQNDNKGSKKIAQPAIVLAM